MNIIQASVLTDIRLFREELSADFEVWNCLPDFYRLAEIPIWRSSRERAEAIYSADRFGLYQRFGIGLEQWIDRCGPVDFNGLANFRQQRKLALAISQRSMIVDSRSGRDALRLAFQIRSQLDRAGVTPADPGGPTNVTSRFAFTVGSVSVEMRVICVVSGIRIQLSPTQLDPAKAAQDTIVSHGLAYVDTFGVLTENELSAVRTITDRGAAEFRRLLALREDGFDPAG